MAFSPILVTSTDSPYFSSKPYFSTCSTLVRPDDDFLKVSFLIANLLGEKSVEFSELKNENLELRTELNDLKKIVFSHFKYAYGNCREIPEKEAQNEIESYLIAQKKEGVAKIGLIPLSQKLGLPIEQVDRIMERLSAKGVKEVD